MKMIRKITKIILIAALTAVLITGVLLTAANIHMTCSTRSKIVSAEESAQIDADCILVLGAGVYGDVATPLLQCRIDKGAEVYSISPTDKIIMSGDNSRVDYNEVSVMKHSAIESGVESKDIFCDHAGFSTCESMYRAKEISLPKK